MRRTILSVLAVLALLASSAAADERALHKNGGIGFRGGSVPTNNAQGLETNAPIGMRWWFGEDQRLGIDLGVGFSTSDDDLRNESLMAWSGELGLPVLLTSWNRLHVLFRPGINYATQERFESDARSADVVTDRFVTVKGEIEAEIFLVENASISASQGIGIVTRNPGGDGGSTTDFTTLGNNFTSLGFHVYLW